MNTFLFSWSYFPQDFKDYFARQVWLSTYVCFLNDTKFSFVFSSMTVTAYRLPIGLSSPRDQDLGMVDCKPIYKCAQER